jgi:hypothetical protein
MAVLALHPNLGDDPGALFELAWASLLTGDLATARGARDELGAFRSVPRLLPTLDAALARAEIAHASSPPDARDYYFLEHGGLVLDDSGPERGRYGARALDRAAVAHLLGLAAWAIRELVVAPRRIFHASEAAAPFAHALARAVGGEAMALPESHGAAGILVARAADELEPLSSTLREKRSQVFTLALALDPRKTVAPAPDFVGAFIRDPSFVLPFDEALALTVEADEALAAFVEVRRAHLPPRGRRDQSAYVPDAPLSTT